MDGLRAFLARAVRVGSPVALAVLVGIWLSCSTDDGSPRVEGVYAKITVEVEPSPDDPLDRLRPAGSRTVIRWWYTLEPVRWRWEIEGSGTVIDDGTSLTVFDGGESWGYDDRLNVYQRGLFPELPAGAVPSPLFSAPVGPANAETVEAFIERWREGSGVPVVRAGEAMILGVQTQIVEIGSPPAGISRVFVDPERMFIMRWAVEGAPGRQSYRAEVTMLDHSAEIDASRFTFDPPPGAVEVQAVDGCSSSVSSDGGSPFHSVRGFFRPSYAPPGYRSEGGGSAGSDLGDCRIVAAWSLLESSDEAYILLYQRVRAGGIPQAVRSWERLDSDLGEVYYHSEGGIVRLVWGAADVVALLETNSATVEELLLIAESAELAP